MRMRDTFERSFLDGDEEFDLPVADPKPHL
jgi:hypothetical protein